VKKPRVLFVINFLLCISFFAKGQEKKVVYSDSSISKMVVTNFDSTGRDVLFSIEKTTYSVDILSVNGEHALFAFKKTSKLDGGQPAERDGIEHHLVSADFISLNNKQKSFSVKYDCDDIILHWNYYETITNGCCDIMDFITYYSYEKQKEICEGDRGILSYTIPNGNLTCFIGYTTKSHAALDTSGTLYIGYNTGELFKINIPGRFVRPKIKIVTGNPKDNIYDTYTKTSEIWSLNKISSVNLINNLKISLIFSIYKGNYTEEEKVVDIPIINGKPFGKEDKEQTLTISETK
jgi:hypothetical protein